MSVTSAARRQAYESMQTNGSQVPSSWLTVAVVLETVDGAEKGDVPRILADAAALAAEALGPALLETLARAELGRPAPETALDTLFLFVMHAQADALALAAAMLAALATLVDLSARDRGRFLALRGRDARRRRDDDIDFDRF